MLGTIIGLDWPDSGVENSPRARFPGVPMVLLSGRLRPPLVTLEGVGV